jgi:hypothetical protein
VVAKYRLNRAGVEHARGLIRSRQYVLDSDWGQAQPRADAQNAYLERHSWEEYAAWHLGLTEGASDGTKARYALEWRHKEIELAAHDLLQELDASTATRND